MTDAKALRRIRLFLFLAVVLLAIAAFADSLAPHDPYLQDLDLSLLPPGGTYPLGTDRFGRCVLSRVIAGSTISIYASLAVVALTFVLGTVTGLVAGFSGGWIDTALMRITDVFLAFPVLVFAIVAAAMFSGIGGAQFSGLTGAILALALISWPKYARLVRSQVLAIRHRPFISAARFFAPGGCTDLHHDDGRHRYHDARNGGPVLPGTGGAAAGCGMGPHDQFRPQSPADCAVGHFCPGRGAVPHRHHLQFVRRQRP